MPKLHDDPIAEELGKALADRLGLRHDDTLKDWSAEYGGGKTVLVTMQTVKAIPRAEFVELQKLAEERAARR